MLQLSHTTSPTSFPKMEFLTAILRQVHERKSGLLEIYIHTSDEIPERRIHGMDTCIYIYINSYIVYMYVHPAGNTYIYIHTSRCICLYIYICIYIHIYIYLYLSTCEVLWITLCGWRSLPDDPGPAWAKPTNCNYGVTSFIRGSRTEHMGRKMIDCEVVVVTSFIRSSSRTTKEIIILLLNALFMYITSCVYHC